MAGNAGNWMSSMIDANVAWAPGLARGDQEIVAKQRAAPGGQPARVLRFSDFGEDEYLRGGKFRIMHYSEKAVGSATGPLPLDQTMSFCRLLEDSLVAHGAAVVATEPGDAGERANVAVVLGAYLALKRGWDEERIEQAMPAEGDKGFYTPWLRENACLLCVRHCWAGLCLARDYKWITADMVFSDMGNSFACSQYARTLLEYDAAWLAPGELIVAADPMTVIRDPNLHTCRAMCPEEPLCLENQRITTFSTFSAAPSGEEQDLDADVEDVTYISPETDEILSGRESTFTPAAEYDEEFKGLLQELHGLGVGLGRHGHQQLSPRPAELPMEETESLVAQLVPCERTPRTPREKVHMQLLLSRVAILETKISSFPKPTQQALLDTAVPCFEDRTYEALLETTVPVLEDGTYEASDRGPSKATTCHTVCKSYHDDNRAPPPSMPSSFVSWCLAQSVGLIVRVNSGDEHGMKEGGGSYDAERIKGYGIGHLDAHVLDRHGGVPAPSTVAKLLDRVFSLDPSQTVLVHCKGGFGRSVVLACCILIHRHNIPGSALLGWARIVRPGCFTTLEQVRLMLKLSGRAALATYVKSPPCCSIS